jgi:protocatechuate 3,4-dioxygenase beta subunit
MKTLVVLIALAAAIPIHGAVSGSVLTTEGAPLPNARVTAFRPVPQMRALVEYTQGRQPAALASSVTDQKGAFVLDVAGDGLIDLHVDADGFAPADVLTALDEPVGTIAMRSAATKSGQVTASGKPVSNAFVVAVPARGLPLFATTDAQGRYRLPDPQTWAQMIVVRHPDFMPAGHPATSLDFSLEPGQDIHGKVLDANGKPAAGAAIDIGQIMTATSADDGTFVIRHAPRQAGSVRARTASGTAVIPFTAGTPVLKLMPVARISGVVRDASKVALSGITVMVVGGRTAEVTVTDARGAFALSGLPRDNYQLLANGDPVYSTGSAKIDATVGDTTQDLVATKQTILEGIVRDAENKPVEGAAISMLYEVTGSLMVMPAEIVTAADGRFRLRQQIESEMKLRIAAVKPGVPPGISAYVRNRTPVAIAIPKGVAVEGVVAGPDKKPLAGVRVEPMIGMSGPEMRGETPGTAWATTDEAGRFHGNLTDTTKALTFAKQGYVSAQQVVEIAKGMEPLRVALTRSLAVRGHVVNKDGSPAGDVTIAVAEKMAMSSPDGSFAIEGLSAGGSLELRFGRAMGGMQEQVVTVPADDLKLVLPAMRSIHGRVVDAVTGAPVEKFTVEAVRGNGNSHFPQPFESPAGEFSVEAAEGEVRLNVAAAGFTEAKNVLVPLTGVEPLSVKLSRGRTLRGSVVDEKGQPLAAVTVNSGAGRGLSEEQQPQTRPDGSFEIRGLSFDDETRVSFEKSGYLKAERKVAAGRDDIILDLTLRRGISFSGRVLDHAGAAAAGVSVEASSAGHGADYVSAQTDASGAFQFDALAPARYDFKAEREETAERGAAKDIDVEKTHELIIRLEARPSATVFGHVAGIDPSQSMQRSVFASNAEGDSSMAILDLSGNYRIEKAPVGLVSVQATSYGRSGSKSSAKVTVEVQPGAEVRADLAYPTQVALRGHVTRAGAPVGGATIRFSGQNDQNALTAPDGAYETMIDPGEYDVTIAAGQSALPFAKHITVEQASEIDLRIAGASIIATVLDSGSSEPIAGATVTIAPLGETHTAGSGTTGPEGIAAIDVAQGTEVTVVASRRGYANASSDLTASGTASVVLRLVRSPGAVIRVVDVRDGRTLSGNVIARSAAGGVVASADQTDPDGTVTLPLAAGTYRFSASAEGYGSHTLSALVPAGEIRLPLPRGGNLAIKSNVDAAGSARLIQPDGEEYVRCWCSGIAKIKLDGRVTLVDRIAPGPYVLEVTVTNGKPKRFPVSIVEGQTMTVPID